MTDEKITCPRCGYQNQPHRIQCKNCGKGLTAEAALRQDFVVAKRKKPLSQGLDWLKAVIGFVFFVVGLGFGIAAILFVIHLSLVSLLFLVLAIGLLYGGWMFFLLPFYSLYVYRLGHEVTKGQITGSFQQEFSDADGGHSRTIHYVVINFTPEKSPDPRPRLLTCEISPGTMMSSEPENKEILVYYAIKNPEVMLFEGEVQS